ncbi:MAG: stage V sporulation protein S [Bacilli bacterium]|nr:stage V sporulation protein S [Bacilli bacterium]
MEILKVSSKSNPNSVAGAITNILKRDNIVELQSIGAGALNQLVKSIIVSRGFIIPSGKDLNIVPSFNEVNVNNLTRTAIKFTISLI